MKPLIYLELRGLLNSIKYSVRTPKRLIPMLIMAAWVFSSFFQGIIILASNGSKIPPNPKLLSAIPITLIESGLFLFLSIGCVLTMYGAFKSGLMVFTVAHIDFLFPTPISRRKVLLIKLIKDYFKLGFFIAFFYVFLGSMVFGLIGVQLMPWGLVGITALTALMILVINLAHTINIVFTFGWDRLSRLGIAIKAALIIVPATALICGLNYYAQTHDGLQSLKWAAGSPLVSVVFAPAKWCAAFAVAPLSHVAKPYGWEYFFALLGLSLASAVILITRKENIYEPSLGISVKFARARAAARSGDYSTLRTEAMREKGQKRVRGSSIPPFGRGASAFLWKNLVLRLRGSRTQIMLMAVMAVAIIYPARIFSPHLEIIKLLPMLFIYVIIGMSMATQMEMRAELRQANIVKTMPITPWKIILAQTMSSVILVTCGVWALSVCLWLLLPNMRGPNLVSAAATTPFLCFSIVPFAIIPAILYPDVRDLVQNYLSGLFGFLFTSIGAAPPIVIALVSILVLRMHMYTAVALACGVCVLMGLAGMGIASRALRAFDPSTE